MKWVTSHRLANGAAALAIAIAPLVGLALIRSWTYDFTADEVYAQLTRLDQSLHDLRSRDVQQFERRIELRKVDFLTSTSDELANAELQSRLRDVITSRGSELRSARSLAPVTLDDLKYLGVRVQFVSDLIKLREIIYELEFRTPILLVRRLTIRHVEASQTKAVGGQFAVELDAFGARWPREPGRPAS